MKQSVFFRLLISAFLSTVVLTATAEISNPLSDTTNSLSAENPVDQRTNQEDQLLDNPFLISLYKPNYFLPFLYNTHPTQAIYSGHTPDQENIKKTEVNFQLSFKVPLWRQVYSKKSTLYLAYSQKSYWQAYTTSAFFRETDYEPELFLANHLELPLIYGWQFNFLNIGAVHQSNGLGGELERSWNRLYLEAIFAQNNWMVSAKPWYVFPDASLHRYNPDLTHYLGHGNLLIAYKYHKQTIALETGNTFESGFSRGQERLTWSFPIKSHIKGFVQLFSGYGQNLIEYNHYNNSIGMGIAINDWI